MLLLSAREGFKSFEDVYAAENLMETERWLQAANVKRSEDIGVRIITAAPEIPGVMDATKELTARGIVVAIGHRYVIFSVVPGQRPHICL
jgi:N-acetylglucosamine-6-phosphate deacetylase